MKVAVFSAKRYDREFFTCLNDGPDAHELTFFEPHLSHETAQLAAGFPAVCVFVNDTLDRRTLEQLAAQGTRIVALRCAGFNNVDLPSAEALGIHVVRVPAYSPHAVAEHTVTLMLCLNRRVHRAYNRIREGNFSLEGLLGFDMVGKTVGLIGTGKIGQVTAKILSGFGCRLLATDRTAHPDCEALGVTYLPLDELVAQSDVISLHCPLTPETHHLINAELIAKMKPGVMIINTSRGAIIDTSAVVDGLKSGQIGGIGLDVYEEEGDLFFEDLSNEVIQDDVFTRLLTFPNVLITGHQAFFTREALEQIASVTLHNIRDIERNQPCINALTHPEPMAMQAKR